MKESQKLPSDIKPTAPKNQNEITNPRNSMNKKNISKKDQYDKHILNIENFKIFKPAKESKLSKVYFVKDERSNKKYAAKSSLQEQDPDQQLFILREINILMKVQHCTIVGFEGVSFQDFDKHDKISIFMNYIERGSLADLLNDERLSLLPIEYDDTNRQIILVGISYGMDLLHKNNIIHRDLKAENILIDNEFKPHITDFGLSKFFDTTNSQFQSMLCCGTIEYMAPEVIEGEGFNTKADVYSFGILMYEVVTGFRAYSKNKKEGDIFRFMKNIKNGMRPEFPDGYPIKKEIKALINKCWSKNPNERPTFSEIYKMLSLTDSKYGDSYCLDGVDNNKLSLYIDEITTDFNDDDNDNVKNIFEEENKKLKRENLKLKNDNDQMNKTISKIQNENLKLKNVNDQMNMTISKIQNENLKLTNSNQQLQKEITKMNEIISNLKIKQNEIKVSNPSKTTLEKIQDKVKNNETIERSRLPQLHKDNTSMHTPTSENHHLAKEDPMKECQEILNQVGLGTLKAVHLPQISTIPNKFFYFQKNLEEIDIPSSVTSIGSYAFSGCSSLTQITIPSSVTSIGEDAFYGCSSLTKITIPSSATSIGSSSFSGCSSLTQITIPSSVTKIGNYTFYGCSSLTQITIPSSVTSIGNSAFNGCSSLTQISNLSSVTSIGNYAFNGCSLLTQITIPSSVTKIGNYTFYGCSSLTQITIPSSATSIGNYSFSRCSSLAHVSISSSVTSIGSSSFSGCSSLSHITIPSSVTSIGSSSFSGCSSLKQITIPSSVTSIGPSAFSGCSSLTQITIPSSVTEIGSSAFSGCSSLKQISIPSKFMLNKIGIDSNFKVSRV